MIKVSSGFQSSVNIAFDLNNNGKLKQYIPTKSAMGLLSDILKSMMPEADNRARILIGAYGKGKSHIVLMILAVLMKKDIALFKKMIPIMEKEYPDVLQEVYSYYERDSMKALPVVVTGSSNSVSQALILALQHTLEENELEDCMPETTFKAATSVIERWKDEYPDTYKMLQERLEIPVDVFENNLKNYDTQAYALFEQLYPSLTSGSTFSPFIGLSVCDLYEEAVRGIKRHGYNSIYIIYDEFSKYLESHIAESAKDDTKVLQDLAEKCNRSGADGLHMMLISHKEITSYLNSDTAKKVVDGWRGVSERFLHVYLNNNFSQTYEVIASAIEKDTDKWKRFKKDNRQHFSQIKKMYMHAAAFSELDAKEMKQVIEGCYPLHPISTYILPRLSERVAQNERTLFTFISSTGKGTLTDFIKTHDTEHAFCSATPDIIYDYFQPLMKQEVYSGTLHKYYLLTQAILRNLPESSLESRLIKSLSLIYILEQFENIIPTEETLYGIFQNEYEPDTVHNAINGLIERKYVIYQKRSNNYLRLKETSGIDIQKEIEKYVQKNSNRFTLKDVLNTSNFDTCLYPSRYNDEKEMTRYFLFRFIDSSEIDESIDLSAKARTYDGDGIVFAILTKDEDDRKKTDSILRKLSSGHQECLFVMNKHHRDIMQAAKDFQAVTVLKEDALIENDRLLYDDYDVVYEDLQEVVRTYIAGFTRPELNESYYYYNGTKTSLKRKAELTALLSEACYHLYPRTPVVNNEVINRNELTGTTKNSRNKILQGLSRDVLEPNLGLTGTGQEMSIMRSTLLRTGVLVSTEHGYVINRQLDDQNLTYTLSVIDDFIGIARSYGTVSFDVLYQELTSSEKGIGLRKGLIPIYLAAVLHEYKNDIVIKGEKGELHLSAESLIQIEASPGSFHLEYINWDAEKEAYIRLLGKELLPHIENPTYAQCYQALKSWYLRLPKYSKELKKTQNGESIPKRTKRLIFEIKKGTSSYEAIFKGIPEAYGKQAGAELATELISDKSIFDSALSSLKENTEKFVKSLFRGKQTDDIFELMSTGSVVRDWLEILNSSIYENIFNDGTNRTLLLMRDHADSSTFIEDLAKVITGLRMEDWNDATPNVFRKRLEDQKNTAESFVLTLKNSSSIGNEEYQLSYSVENGETVTKRFQRTEGTKWGKLLSNQINDDIRSMGHSITEAEIRQILVDILSSHC